jgi:hypothetical protein
MNSVHASGATITITPHEGEPITLEGRLHIPNEHINRNDCEAWPNSLSGAITVTFDVRCNGWRVYDTLSKLPRAPRKVAQWKREQTPLRYR